jgi:hypothetical protein
MNCKNIGLLVYRRGYENLSLAEQRLIDEHLVQCSTCQQLQVRLSKVIDEIVYDQKALNSFTLNDEFINRIYQKINTRVPVQNTFIFPNKFMPIPAAVVATLFLFFVVGIVYRVGYVTFTQQVEEIMQSIDFYQNIDLLQNYELINQSE